MVLSALFAYFLPTVVAEARGHQRSGMIFLANLLLGWTILGWIGALVWAATAVRRQTRDETRRWRGNGPI
jgi:threonine/homoserine/homoserine lactone efflux protein